jgi:hypothetical protein
LKKKGKCVILHMLYTNVFFSVKGEFYETQKGERAGKTVRAGFAAT